MRVASILTVAGIVAIVGVGTSASATTYISIPGMSGVPETEDWSQFTRANLSGAVEAVGREDWHIIDFPLPVITAAAGATSTVSADVVMGAFFAMQGVNCQLVTFTSDGQNDQWTNTVYAEKNVHADRYPLAPRSDGQNVPLVVHSNGTAIVRCQIYNGKTLDGNNMSGWVSNVYATFN